jgi:hypothetical protein
MDGHSLIAEGRRHPRVKNGPTIVIICPSFSRGASDANAILSKP